MISSASCLSQSSGGVGDQACKKPNDVIDSSVHHLKQGHIIAYPTEAVYGLGCDPFNRAVVEKLARLKRRSSNKGIILVASEWSQVSVLIKSLSAAQMSAVWARWPGPHTWVFPASNQAPEWLLGPQNTIALRISDHPAIVALTQAWRGPITSTSANFAGQPPLLCYEDVCREFQYQLGYVLPGQVGDSLKPSSIQDVLTLEMLRRG